MLAGELVEFGSHSHTHADFREQPGGFEPDLRASLDALRGRFGLADFAFAFPFGYFTAAMSAATENAGVSCALTASHELGRAAEQPFCLESIRRRELRHLGFAGGQVGRMVHVAAKWLALVAGQSREGASACH